VSRLPAVVLASELGSARIAAGLKAGEWERVGRGAYLRPASGTDRHAQARERALAQIAGVAARTQGPTAFSHVSAALLHGLTLWRLPEQPHVIQRSSASGWRDRGVVRHLRRDGDDELVEIAEVRVTTLERTVVDCVAMLPPLDGLVLADSALAAGAEPHVLADLLARARGSRNVGRVRTVLRFADGGAESAYESACRFVVLRGGLPVPETQVPVRTRLGEVWSDWGWPEHGVLGEYDGRDKYDDRTAMMREKRRHDALLEAGRRVVRVVKEDLRGTGLAERFLRLMPARVRASTRPRPELIHP
jgi:hypothetical protein